MIKSKNGPQDFRQGTLFITYDGLLDPLGGSQIVPYLEEIAAHPRKVHVLSFEKADRVREGFSELRCGLDQLGIEWTRLKFTQRLGGFGKVWDLLKMYITALFIVIADRPAYVHARSHAAAQVGLFLKRCFGLKLIFDFRGLWVDERVDKGGWDLKCAHHRWQYYAFKRTERELLANTDQLVVLTEAVVPEVHRLGATQSTNVTVIPCCADFEHFALVVDHIRSETRETLEIPKHALVLGYLGSVGRMYRLDRVFRLFEMAIADHYEAHLLVVTQDLVCLKNLMGNHLPFALRKRVQVTSATRLQVPKFIAAMDVLVSFIQPSYARMAASPTKIAECFATGIPVICNSGVGDVAEQVRSLEAGRVVDIDSDEELTAAVLALPYIAKMGGARLRDEARKVLGLEVASQRYRAVYAGLDTGSQPRL
jgi:glycosyltransferase involved in cell wall biosynthesis